MIYLKTTVFQALLGIILMLSAQLVFSSPSVKTYYVDEPVFGGQAYIIEAGQKNRPLIVMVHGLGDIAGDTWKQIIPRLSKHFHILAFDLPGFGRSTKANELYSPDNYVAFVNFLVKKLGYNKFMLVGHSMGGNIALRYASTYPHKVERLMLIDAAGVLHRITYASFFSHYGINLVPQFYPNQGRDIRSIASALVGELARQHGMVETGEQLILNQPQLRQKVFGGNPSTIAAYAMIMTDYTDQLASMKVPTMVLWGRDDNVIPLRTGRVLATNLRNAGLVIIDDAGHVPMRDKPQEFAFWLRKFVTGNEDEFQKVIEQQRYTIDTLKPIATNRIASCENEAGKTFTGDYKLITIINCRNVEIDSARIQSLTIRNSSVAIHNSFIKSYGKAILIEDSDLQVNGSTISGQPAIEFKNTPMDIAGSYIQSDGTALINTDEPVQAPRHPGPLGRLMNNDTTLIFSVSKLSSKYFDKTLHGPVQFQPEQAW